MLSPFGRSCSHAVESNCFEKSFVFFGCQGLSWQAFDAIMRSDPRSMCMTYKASEETLRPLRQSSDAEAASTSGRASNHIDSGEWQQRFSIEGLPAADEGLQRSKAARFIDKLRITAQAGKGGNGCQSKWASRAKGKFRPPDGGNGGRGGDVILRACHRTRSLAGLEHLHKASPGGHGGVRKLAGSQGEHCIIPVPPGTVVYLPDQGSHTEPGLQEGLPYWLRNPGKPWVGALHYESSEDTEDEGEHEASSESVQKQRLGQEVADLRNPGDECLLARGGDGGRGNAFHSTQVRKSKDLSLLKGHPGERVTAHLEMRTIADIGLVGLPNAGKSSLLKLLSSADSKVANYPFTTLQPQLGVVKLDPFHSVSVADIPGLIPGAARNKGLGHAFLRHISRAKALVFVLDSASGLADSPGPRPWQQFSALQEELLAYSRELHSKPALVVATKADKLLRPEQTFDAMRRRIGLPIAAVCALPESDSFDPGAVSELKQKLVDLVQIAEAGN